MPVSLENISARRGRLDVATGFGHVQVMTNILVRFSLGCVFVALMATQRGLAFGANEGALLWKTREQVAKPKTGETTADFVFVVTNASPQEVLIISLRTSCSCTTAQLPPLPGAAYRLAPGASATIGAVVDLRDKAGTFTKEVFVETSVGPQTLQVRVELPVDPWAALTPGQLTKADRVKNIERARVNRTAIFQGDCASCHAEPARGKTGAKLFAAACGICHEAEHRASLVPDLSATPGPHEAGYWEKWIREGREGTMMPGFDESHGGPLKPEQVASLVEYLAQRFR